MLTKARRIVKTGFVNFWRNGLLSFAAIVVLTLCLVSFGLLIFGNAFGQGLINEFKSKVDITVYFTLDAKEADILGLQKTVNALPEVASSTYVTRDQALEDFKERWQNNSLILNSLDEIGGNPF